MEKLDLINKKLLAELDKDCRVSHAVLGKKVRRSREAVKYRIGQLQRKGIIQGFVTYINPSRLGFFIFKVYLKLENIPAERERFYEFLKSNKDVYWLGIFDGAFDCIFAILSKSNVEYYEKINSLLSQWSHLIISKILGAMVDTQQYNKKFFTNNRGGSYSLVGGAVIDNKIDDLDLGILGLIANDARVPLVVLARKFGVTLETIKRRIKILEEKGVIIGYRIAVNFDKLELEYFKVLVYFKSLSKNDENSLLEWMRAHSNSLYYVRSLAPWEVELEFAVESYIKLNSLLNELREKFPIRNHESLIMAYEFAMPAYKPLMK